MITSAELETVYKMDLKPNEKGLLIYLKHRCSEDGKCFPSQETMAKDLGISDRTIRTVLKSLLAKKLIEVTKRFSKTALIKINSLLGAQEVASEACETSVEPVEQESNPIVPVDEYSPSEGVLEKVQNISSWGREEITNSFMAWKKHLKSKGHQLNYKQMDNYFIGWVRKGKEMGMDYSKVSTAPAMTERQRVAKRIDDIHDIDW